MPRTRRCEPSDASNEPVKPAAGPSRDGHGWGPRHWTRGQMLLGACLLGGALFLLPLAVAAPVLPNEDALNGDVQSLAGIDRVRLELDVNVKAMELEPEDEKRVATTFREALADQGIRIVKGDDAQVPLLRLAVRTKTAVDVPKAVVVMYHITVTQNVVVERLAKKVSLPTYSLIQAALVQEKRVRERLDQPLRSLVNLLAKEITEATEAGK